MSPARPSSATCCSRSKAANAACCSISPIFYISSAGLRIVLLAAKRMKSAGGRLVLCSLNPQIAEVFDISGFTRILDILPSRDAAFPTLTT